ncbi:YebC/PmpR family DNA-binding transcriptional regulator [Aeoliella sp. ICT_H6.2]|uniref:Probable transcriptional regulatory protein NG895_22885 n=1 Tax=Aeoliella straminimaris TaxID=2954799 RepID=A0A9X2JJH9_9BACT|nr:YebC/PmpR family DNA-binding transcriptional regulator [Aeoliella straminimaris]MCO6046753.1 YebC/PmpR family DNA-binding transcriptional regulator [Aeoliella straminimaris]
MAGHSHWANIARKKSAIDAKRGKVWSKLSKAIIVAARMGGGDPDANLRLRYAINDAKAVSMPKDNIERAIKKGTGELDGGNLEEVLYEGIGPAGVAIMCEILTDNRNRTAPEIRKLFEVCGGKLGATGCAAWTFDRKGVIVIADDKTNEESLMELAIEAGADDVRHEDGSYEVVCEPDAYSDVCDAIAAAEIETESRDLTWVPKDTIDLSVDDARNVLKLMERLDDHDDVQNVAANFDISDEVMAEIEAAG